MWPLCKPASFLLTLPIFLAQATSAAMAQCICRKLGTDRSASRNLRTLVQAVASKPYSSFPAGSESVSLTEKKSATLRLF